MRFRLSFILCLICAAFQPAAAQQTLDRVDPARAEERALERSPEKEDRSEPVRVEQQAPSTATGSAYAVGAIDLVGLKAMPRSSFSDIIEAYLGQTLSPTDLATLVDRLAARARVRYPLASASIEPQAVRAGVLRVRIDEGCIDDIQLTGTANRAVLAALKSLATGQPVTALELERRLLIAGDIDGVTLGKPVISREGDRNILVVSVRRQRVRAQLTLDNDSTKPLGPLELFGSARINGVLADDDSLQIFALDTVPELEELAFGRVRYGKRISADGTELSVTASYSHNAPGAYLEPLDIVGESWLVALGALHPLVRTRDTSLWVEGDLSHRQVRQQRTRSLAREDRLTVARLGLYGYTDAAGGRLRVNATLSQGLDLLGATRSNDALASRDDSDGTFTSVAIFADWKTKIAGQVGTRLAVRTQLASQPLLVSEEQGIGGASFVRGYDYSERSGDQAVMGYMELNYDWDKPLGVINSLQFYAFADGGKAENLQNGFGNGALFSTGAGARADVDSHTDAGLELAVPLSGDRYDTDNAAPRIRFSLTRYF